MGLSGTHWHPWLEFGNLFDVFVLGFCWSLVWGESLFKLLEGLLLAILQTLILGALTLGY